MTHLLHDTRCRDKNQRDSNSNFAGIGYLIGGLALVALSAAINIRHSIGHAATDRLDMVLASGLALAMTIGFIVTPAIASRASRNGERGIAFAAWIAVLICGGISLTNIAGASMGARLSSSAIATDASDKRTDARKAIVTAENELATIGAVRPSAAIQSEIAGKLVSRNDLDGCDAKWLPSTRARQVCIEVSALRAELAKAERKSRLEGLIEDSRVALTHTKASDTVGSGDTAAIVALAAKFGFAIEPDTVDLLKSIGLALGVELFAALLFVAWDRSGPVPQQHSVATSTNVTALPLAELPPVPPVPALEWPEKAVGRPLAAISSPPGTPGCPEPDAAEGHAVLSALRARGGALLASQRTMADLFGMSRSSVNRALHELAASGKVRLVTTAKGTAVTLVEAA